MKARPILFSGPMVRALLDGTKTQTRRVVKSIVPDGKTIGFCHYVPTGYSTADQRPDGGPGGCDCRPIPCPYGLPGDLLWVRETWACYRRTSYEYDEWEQVATAAERAEYSGTLSPVYAADKQNYPEQWHPSIHMPRWASRLTLEITDVRVERLQDISTEDAVAEGIERTGPQTFRSYTSGGEIVAPRDGDAARVSYFTLWQSINGMESYQSNPFVWVIEFTVHKCNVDALLRQRGES